MIVEHETFICIGSEIPVHACIKCDENTAAGNSYHPIAIYSAEQGCCWWQLKVASKLIDICRKYWKDMSLLVCPNSAKQRQSVNHNLKKHCSWFVCGLTAWMAPKVITKITKVKLNSTLKLITVSSGHRAIFCNIINIDSFVLSNGKKKAHPNFTIYYSLIIISNYAVSLL